MEEPDLLFYIFADAFLTLYCCYAVLGVCMAIEWWQENRRKRDVDG